MSERKFLGFPRRRRRTEQVIGTPTVDWDDCFVEVFGRRYRVEERGVDHRGAGELPVLYKCRGHLETILGLVAPWLNEGTFDHILEIGVWDGASLALWYDMFNPRRLVGIDIDRREDSPWFTSWIKTQRLDGTVSTRWGVDQSDPQGLRNLVQQEFGGSLDLVIDDGSHHYDCTKASFEAVMPFLRPGGKYVIEDWAWPHWPEFQDPTHPWAAHPPLSRLVFEITQAAGSISPDCTDAVITRVDINRWFAVVDRGTAVLDDSGGFRLEDLITRRPGDRFAPVG